jgi:hypothetical protein
MSPARLFLAVVVGLCFTPLLHAGSPPEPLRLLPADAGLCMVIEHPGRVLDWVLHNDVFARFRELDGAREFYESTNYRRFLQLVGHLERQLGIPRTELLERLAGRGAALGVTFAPSPAPVVVVIEGRDAATQQQFFRLATEILEQELARQEIKERPERSSYEGVATIRVGKLFHACVVGRALVYSNSEDGLRRAIDRHKSGGKNSLADVPTVAQGQALAVRDASDPFAWLWLNLETVRKAPGAKEVFQLPRNDLNLTVLFGGWLDIAGRSPFLAASLAPSGSGLGLHVRMPRGREGMPEALAVHVPPAGQAGARPLLEPPGVLYSASYYLDVGKFWDQRSKLFTEKQVKTLEEFDKGSAKFLAGSRLSQLLTQAGAYERFIVTRQVTAPYQTAPRQRLPAFSLVLEMRDPEVFPKRMNAVLRAAALLATTQVKLKLTEEDYKGRHIVGYRFPEDAPLAIDTEGIRYNFSPCFVAVGNQFVAASTFALCHQLVDLLERETSSPSAPNRAAHCQQGYAQGGAELLETFKDRLFTQTILDKAIPPAEAESQVRAFMDWVRRLGRLRIESQYNARDFSFDLTWQPVSATR